MRHLVPYGTVMMAISAALAGCAGLAGHDCPDISGRYANRAGDGERLAPLLLEEAASSNDPAVSLAMDREHHQLLVSTGSRKRTLQEGMDFVCDGQGLRLVKPQQSQLDLGEMLVHTVDVFHRFSKAGDGSLLAVKSTKERASIAHVPLAGPEREGASVQWKPSPPR